MNIFITGCAGFIGSSLAERLLEKGHKIVGLDNFDPYYKKELKQKNINSFVNNPNFKLYIGDIRDVAFIDEIFSEHKFDVVIHLAAKAGVRASFENPAEYVDVNVNGTLHILNFMNKHKIPKLVFSSSSSVYGNLDADSFSEDMSGLVPISPYAVTKKTAEEMIKIYTENFNINAVCLRFFTVYGPKQRPNLAIYKFAERIINDEPLPMFGDGTTSRDYTYIDDITDGIIEAVNYDKTPFEIINLGSASPITLKEMISALEEEIGKKAQIEHLSNQPGDVEKTFANIQKAEKLLGYKPKVTFREGLKHFLEYTFSWEEQNNGKS